MVTQSKLFGVNDGPSHMGLMFALHADIPRPNIKHGTVVFDVQVSDMWVAKITIQVTGLHRPLSDESSMWIVYGQANVDKYQVAAALGMTLNTRARGVDTFQVEVELHYGVKTRKGTFSIRNPSETAQEYQRYFR